VLLGVQLLMPLALGHLWSIALFLLVFFGAFNVLEATLPTLTSRTAPSSSKGAAIGVYSSFQFLGAFVGAAAGGFAYSHWGGTGVVILDALWLVIWLVLASGTRVKATLSTRTYALPALDGAQAERLTARLEAVAGVHEVDVSPPARTAHLRVDSYRFDEDNVLKLIAGET
jgi:MFS family permease